MKPRLKHVRPNKKDKKRWGLHKWVSRWLNGDKENG